MMNKALYVVVCSLWTACAVAQETWSVDPFHWKQSGDTLEARGMGDSFLEREDATIFARVTISARVTPATSGTNGWSTLGLAVRENDKNFWHLAFVRGPDGSRYLELSEMRNATWLAHALDNLPCTRSACGNGAWRSGETYDCALSLDENAVRGTIRDATGRIIFDTTFRTSGKPCVRGGAPALHRMGCFTGRFTDLRFTTSVALPPPETKPLPPYVCENFARGVTGRATGFFHTEQIADRWWVIDPLGRGYVACGCDHVSYNAGWSARTKRSRHREANDRLYATRADWEATTVRRLLDWGFNQLGAGCDPNLRHRGLSHTIFLSMGDALCYGDDDEYYILRNEKRPCSSFPNVFHPQFAAWCDSVARSRCRPHRDDPWLYGYYLDNEFRWWGHGDVATGLFDDVARLATNHTARIALEEYLMRAVKGGRAAFEKLPAVESRAIKLGFLKICAEKYFAACAAAIRKHDPNHMILGARFAGLDGAHEAVWTIAGQYTDIVTFNCYPWCDLNREAMFTYRHSTNTVADAFAARYAAAKKPLQITEWSFPALDVSLPCLHGAGQRMPTQKERVKATEICAKTFLALPFVVGYDYFMWADQAAEGISDEFPEDSNYGLLNVDAKPYPELTAMFTRLQKDVARWRMMPLPQPKACFVRPEQRAEGAWRLAAAKSSAAFSADAAGAFALRSADVCLKGHKGGGGFFASFQRGGREYGPVSSMLSVRMANGSRGWIGAAVTEDVVWDAPTQTLIVSAKGGYDQRTFAVKMLFRMAGARVFCAAVEVANVGSLPIEAYEIYICVRSPFAAETAATKGETPPNVWREEAHTGWQAKDGRRIDVVSCSDAIGANFNYWVGEPGSIHPDAAFFLPGADYRQPIVIAPRSRLDLKGTCWAWLEPTMK